MSEQLKLKNQVCFPVYTLAKEIISLYRPLLKEVDLTYPQYLVMMVLWEEGNQSVSEIGTKLNLEHSGISNYAGETAIAMFESFKGGWDNCISGLTAFLKEEVNAG